MIEEAEQCGLNPYILLCSRAFGVDPVRVSREWTVLDTVEMMKGSQFLDILEWARSPAPKD